MPAVYRNLLTHSLHAISAEETERANSKYHTTRVHHYHRLFYYFLFTIKVLVRKIFSHSGDLVGSKSSTSIRLSDVIYFFIYLLRMYLTASYKYQHFIRTIIIHCIYFHYNHNNLIYTFFSPLWID